MIHGRILIFLLNLTFLINDSQGLPAAVNSDQQGEDQNQLPADSQGSLKLK